MESSNNSKVALYLCVCFCLGGVAVGFNDDIVKPKWSPKFLYEKVYTIPAVLPKHRNLMLPSLPVVYNAPEPKKPVSLGYCQLLIELRVRVNINFPYISNDLII